MDFTTFRADLRAWLSDTLPLVDVELPVVAFLPDDIAELPVVVIGRTGMIASEGVMATFTVWVDLVGRRLADEDAQVELDTLGDGLLAALSVLPANMHLLGIDPQIVTIAGLEYPVHRATVAVDDRLICALPTRRTA
jgi:hypothetical protein